MEMLRKTVDHKIIVAQTVYRVAIRTIRPAKTPRQSYNSICVFQTICFLTTPFDTKLRKLQSSASEKPRKPLIICSF
jgi:hypothetical protein